LAEHFVIVVLFFLVFVLKVEWKTRMMEKGWRMKKKDVNSR